MAPSVFGPYGAFHTPDEYAEFSQESSKAVADAAMAEVLADPDSAFAIQSNATFVGLVQGLVDDDTTDNRAAIQAAVDQGGVVTLPPTNGRYAVTGTINVTVPGTTILTYGAPLRQTLKTTTFEVSAPGVTIDGLRAYGALGAPDLAGTSGAWRETVLASSWCAINACKGADGLTVPWIHASGMSSAVRFTNYDLVAAAPAAGYIQDISLGTVIAEDVEFGVNGRDVTRLSIGIVKGTYGQALNATRQPHLVYLAGSTVNTPASTSVSIGAAIANDSGSAPAQGQAYQFKQVSGLDIGHLQAARCHGVLNISDCSDVEIGSVTSTEDLYELNAWGNTSSLTISGADTVSRRVHIGATRITGIVNVPSVLTSLCEDVTFDRIELVTEHTVTGTSDQYDIQLGGDRTRVKDADVNNIGTKARKAIALHGTGAGVLIDSVRARNVRVGVDTRLNGGRVIADAAEITLHSTDGLYPFTAGGGSGSGGAVIRTRNAGNLFERGVLFGDDFTILTGSNRAIGFMPTGQAWTAKSAGVWSADTDGSAREESSNSVRVIFFDAGRADIRMETRFKWGSGGGLCLRAVDANAFIYAQLTAADVVIGKREGGSNTSLATSARAHTAGRIYNLAAVCIGNVIELYEDGVLALTHTLAGADATAYGATTRFGMRSTNNTERFYWVRGLAVG